jgi:hypothetical protein
MEAVFANIIKDDCSYAFSNWLDMVYSELIKPDFSEEPNFENISIERQAYWASVAHFLSTKLNIKPPLWVFKKKYSLYNPYFLNNAKGSMQFILLFESPIEFRMRNVFVSANALTRV